MIKPDFRFSLMVLRAAVVIGAVLISACSSRPAASQRVSASGQLVSAVLAPARLKLGQVLYTGVVNRLSPEQVVIGNLDFRIDSLTAIPANLGPGLLAKVIAIRLPDNTRYAIEIAALETPENTVSGASQPSGTEESGDFEFYGVVDQMKDGDWTISGNPVRLGAALRVVPGIQVGSTVHVEGKLINGGLAASSIDVDTEHEDESQGDDDQPAGSPTNESWSTQPPTEEETAEATPTASTRFATPTPSESTHPESTVKSPDSEEDSHKENEVKKEKSEDDD